MSVAVMLFLASPADAQVFPGANRVVNSGAEGGLAGWHGTGFGAANYIASGVPRAVSGRVEDPALGAQFFAASEHGAQISQIVDFSDRAASIDSGQQPLSWGADGLGGLAGQSGGARMLVQPLDASGAALGPAHAVGPPSDRDRQYATAMLFCSASTTAPVGMRSVLVSLQAVGGGIADNTFVLDTRLATPASASFPPPRTTDTGGCMSGERAASAPPLAGPPARAPALRSLVSMPAANRCGRPGALRFRVKRSWRSKVERLEVRARGNTTVRGARSVIKLQPPRHTLRVSVRVTLRDGRQSSKTLRYDAGCARR